MAYGATPGMPPASPELSRKAAIVGLGETDYSLDYKARARAPDYEPPTPEGLARDAIDGLSVSFLYGGPGAEEMAPLLGLKPRYAIDNGGIMGGPSPSSARRSRRANAST